MGGSVSPDSPFLPWGTLGWCLLLVQPVLQALPLSTQICHITLMSSELRVGGLHPNSPAGDTPNLGSWKSPQIESFLTPMLLKRHRARASGP